MKTNKTFAMFMACAAFAACEQATTTEPQPIDAEVVAGDVLTSEGVTVKDGPIYVFDAEGGSFDLAVSVTESEGYEDHMTYTVTSSAPWCKAVLADGVLSVEADITGLAATRTASVTVEVSVCDPAGKVAPLTLNIGQEESDNVMDMAYVKAGTFSFGDGLCCTNASTYLFDVKITKDYFMSATEVTQALYEEVMGADLKPDYKDKYVGPKYPVHSVRWIDACEFCNKLSEREGLQKVYTTEQLTYKPDSWSPEQTMTNYVMDPAANGYRLPTSVEWEYAAKGGSEGVKSLFIYPGSNDYNEVAWVKENAALTEGGDAVLHEVAGKQPNQLGIYDMAGNIEEWCYDWSAPYYGYTWPTELVEDFAGTPAAESNYNKIKRGGCYSSAASPYGKLYYTRYASATEPDYYQSCGFRVVRNVK